jgi:DegV family protein with EDD domain
MKLGIVTDSTSDLPPDLTEKHKIEVVPAILVLEGESYADGAGISRQDFYERLPAMRSSPTTAAPSIGEFASRFEKLFQEGAEHIICIHAASQLTTIINSARLASRDFPGRVTVLDSGSLSLGLGFQVLAAAETAEKTGSLESTLSAVQSTRERTIIRASLDTMEYLKRSGRVPHAVAALGGILNIKPFVALKAGLVKPLGAARTTRQGNQRTLEMLLECGKLERLAVLHTNAPERASWVYDNFMQISPQNAPPDVLHLIVTTVIGTHIGPNGVGFAAVKA